MLSQESSSVPAHRRGQRLRANSFASDIRIAREDSSVEMFFLQLARMRVFFLINRLITRREFIRAGKVGYFLPRERD